MKWPVELTLVRHDVSVFNQMKARKEADPEYARFKELYEKGAITEAEQAEMMAIADYLRTRYGLKVGDWNTPLANRVSPFGRQVGANLPKHIALPNIIYVSPYERTLHTLEGIKEGWPELRDVPTVEEDRLREQEHGLALLYNDWRVFQTIHPDQRALRELDGRYWYRYPQGENVPDVRERARSIQNTLVREHAGERVLIITHHLWLLALRANMERWDAEEFIRVDEDEKPINCGVTIYRGNPELGKNGHLVLDKYNLKLYE
jgi:broad specificity phosphatase PhoE